MALEGSADMPAKALEQSAPLPPLWRPRPAPMRRQGGGIWYKAMTPRRHEIESVRERHGESHWRADLIRLINDDRIQIVLLILLMVDVLVLTIELVLDAEFPACHVVERSCAARDDACEVECAHHPHAAEVAHNAMFWLSVVILMIFLVELVLLLVAMGVRDWLRHTLYVVDFVVVLVSLVLEVTLRNVSGDIAGLLIFARLWRLTRITHGVFKETSEVDHKELDKLLADAVTMKAALEARDVNVEELLGRSE